MTRTLLYVPSTTRKEELAMPKQITISDAVHKALLESGHTADEILRECLHVKPEGLVTPEGVTFPEGTFFRVWYKDRPYWGAVENGALVINGERFTSVSAAAKAVTKRPTNGWEFWEARLPKRTDWVRIDALRPKAEGGNGSKPAAGN
jgi:hypothetical protein